MDQETQALIERYVGADVWTQGKTRAAQLVEESVELGRRATRLNWAWGDLSLEVVPLTGRSNPPSAAIGSRLINAWIDEFAFPWSRRTLAQLRFTSSKWPRDKRSRAAWSVHQLMAGHPDRFALIRDDLKHPEAIEMLGYKRGHHAAKGATAIQCANAARSWTRSLLKRLDTTPSEEVVAAVSEAWVELARALDRLGILDESLAGYYESSDDLAVAA